MIYKTVLIKLGLSSDKPFFGTLSVTKDEWEDNSPDSLLGFFKHQEDCEVIGMHAPLNKEFCAKNLDMKTGELPDVTWVPYT